MTGGTPTPRPESTGLDPPVISPVESCASITDVAEHLAHLRFDLELDHAAGHLDLSEQIETVTAALASVAAAQVAAGRLMLADDLPGRITVADALL